MAVLDTTRFQGVDYALSVAPDIDAGNQTIQLAPLKALNPITPQQFTEGAINGYLLIITDRVTRTDGQPAAPDAAPSVEPMPEGT